VSPAVSPAVSAAPIRVLLVDDHSVVCLGLRTLLSAAPEITVVGEASDGAAALELCATLAPRVVVMDLMMKGMDGITATREIVARYPDIRVLVLTMHDEDDYLVPLLDAGAAGYLVKDAASTDLLGAVRTVAAGGTFVRPAAAHVLASRWSRRAANDDARSRYEALSYRERDVFRLMAQGYSSSQIGERLYISGKTVDTYRRRINDKLGVTDRPQYVRLALDLGLLNFTD